MDDPRWLRVITVGLVLAALAVGYYVLTGAFSFRKTTAQLEVGKVVINTPAPSSTPIVASAPSTSISPSDKPDSAYNRIVARNQTQIQTLPNTGVSVGLIVFLSTSIMIGGLGLRKFPH